MAESEGGKFRLTPADFRRFQEYIKNRLGITIDPDLLDILSLRVQSCMKPLGFTEASRYIDHLMFDSVSEEEIRTFLESVLVNETYFFRTKPQIDALRDVIIPNVVRIKRESESNLIRIWCAGCSTGEEAYTLMILCAELLNLPDWNLTILASDISRRALEVARRGEYGRRSLSNVTAAQLDRFFHPTGNGYRVRAEYRQYIMFKELNLLSPTYPAGFDIVLCRNVLIYFDRKDRGQILKKFYESMNNHGYLVVGYSESLRAWPEYFEPEKLPGSVVYRKWSTSRREKSLKWRRERRHTPRTAFKVMPGERQADGNWMVTIVGVIDPPPDSARLEDLAGRLREAAPLSLMAGARLVLDLTQVPYINNHALAVIRDLRDEVRENRTDVRVAFSENMKARLADNDIADLQIEKSDILPHPPRPAPAPLSMSDPPPRILSSQKPAPTRIPAPVRNSFHLRGEWHEDSVAALRRELKPLLDGDLDRLTIDLKELGYLAQEPLQELARFCRLFRVDGKHLRIVSGNENLRRKLARLMNLDEAEAKEILRAQ